MDWPAQLFTVGSIWLVAAMTPGPNFLVTAQISATQSHVRGLAVVGGIGVATAIWGACGLLGVQALFLAAPWAYLAFKIAGAAYLVSMGVRMIANAGASAASIAVRSNLSRRTAFRIGLATSLANPRSALSVSSIFAVALPAHPPAAVGAAAIMLMVLISVGWYVCVVYLFASGAVAAAFQRARRWLDRVAGALLIALGVKLALDRG